MRSRNPQYRVESYDSIEAAASTWRSFETDGWALPYQTLDWVGAWRQSLAHAADITPCPAAVYGADGEPLLFLPLGHRSGTWRGRPRREIVWLGESVGDQLAPIVTDHLTPLDRAGAARLWSEVARALPAADVAVLQNQPATVYDRPNPFAQLLERPSGNSYATALGPDWDAYFRSKTKKGRRADSRRRLRRLQEVGPVTFRRVTDPAEQAPVLQAMFRQKRQRYAQTGWRDMFDEERYEDFYQEVTDRFGGRVLLSALAVGDDVIATDWGVVSHRIYHALVTSFETDEWHRYSPGRLLTEWVLQWCCEHDIDVFDFSTGDEPYKTEWCEQVTPLRGGELACSLRGTAMIEAGRLRRRLARSLPARAVSS